MPVPQTETQRTGKSRRQAGMPVLQLAFCFAARVQPGCAVAVAATRPFYAPCAGTRGTLVPIVRVESASIDADASLPRDCL
jgi:hypothetical protein